MELADRYPLGRWLLPQRSARELEVLTCPNTIHALGANRPGEAEHSLAKEWTRAEELAEELAGATDPGSLELGTACHRRLLSSALALWPRPADREVLLAPSAQRKLEEAVVNESALGPLRLRLAPGASPAYSVGSFFRLRGAFFQGRRPVRTPDSGSAVVDAKAMAMMHLLSSGPRSWNRLRDDLCARDPGITPEDAWLRCSQLLRTGLLHLDAPPPVASAWSEALAEGDAGSRELLRQLTDDPRHTTAARVRETAHSPFELPNAEVVFRARWHRLRLRRMVHQKLQEGRWLALLFREVQAAQSLPGLEARVELRDFLEGLARVLRPPSKWLREMIVDLPRPPTGSETDGPRTPAAPLAESESRFCLARDGGGWTMWEPPLHWSEARRALRLRGEEVLEETAPGSFRVATRCLPWLMDALAGGPIKTLHRVTSQRIEDLGLQPAAVLLPPEHSCRCEQSLPSADASPIDLLRFGRRFAKMVDLGERLVFESFPPIETPSGPCVDLRIPACLALLAEWARDHMEQYWRVRALPAGGVYLVGG